MMIQVLVVPVVIPENPRLDFPAFIAYMYLVVDW